MKTLCRRLLRSHFRIPSGMPVSFGWMNGAVVLPGDELADGTIVGAGAGVTKSFSEGSRVRAGNPAAIIRRLGGEEAGGDR